MLGVLAGMELGVTATKYVAELRSCNPGRAGRIIALSQSSAIASGGLLAIVLIIFGPIIAASTLNDPPLVNQLRIASLLLFLNAVGGAQNGALAGFEAFKDIARINIVRGLTAFPITVAMVFLWRLSGAFWALTATAAITCTLNELALRRCCAEHGIQTKYSSAWVERGILWTFSAPALLSGLLVTPVIWASNAVLVHQTHGYAEMGVFTAASQWRTAITFLPSLLSQPLLSMLSNIGTNSMVTFKKLLRANLLISFGLSTLVAVPVAICSQGIMKAFGHEFRTGGAVLALLAFTTVISSTVAVIGQAMASLEKMWWALTLNGIWAVALMLGAIVLVPRHGALGLAEAYVISYSLHALTVTCYMLNSFNRQSVNQAQLESPIRLDTIT
jgi:O-antigen/teichoic acid export membrane protein